MYQAQQHFCIVPIILAFLSSAWVSGAAADSGRCPDWAAQLVSKEGLVQWQAQGDEQWRDAVVHEHFCPGDQIRVITQRAALRLANDTVVRLDARTTMQLFPEPEGLWVRLLRGAGHFLSRTPQNFEVRSPYLNAAVDGTEFIIQAGIDTDTVTVVEGAVVVSNALGLQRATSGEQVVASENQTPVLTRRIAFQEAAEWTLYFPPLIHPAGEYPQVRLLLEEEAYSEAYALLLSYPATPTQQAVAASIALVLGQPENARDHIDRALAIDPEHPDALAVVSLMLLAAGDRTQALARSRTLKEHHSENISVLLVHAYVLQGNVQLAAAKETIDQTLQLYPDHLTVLARAAELALSRGDHRSAQTYLNHGLTQAPDHSELQTLAGFAALNRQANSTAQEHFQRALAQRSNQPLAHLGLALSLIQDGKLVPAQEHMELAAILDPGNSVLRSYLGRTYFQQKRISWAEEQYLLAQQFDPQDPTPWFFLAHLRWQQNRMPEALRLTSQAIEKNDQRGIYRSQSLLDSDAAARSSGLSDIYLDLGLSQIAQQIAAQSLARSPLDFAAHQAVSNAYTQDPHREVLRTGETLQSVLLAPIGTRQPNFLKAMTSLPPYPWVHPSRMGLGEYGALFSRQSVQGEIETLTGSQQTRALAAQVQGAGSRTQLGTSHLKLTTDGYHANADLNATISEFNIHQDLSDRLKIYAQTLELEEDKGDLAGGINSELGSDPIRYQTQQRRHTVGMAWRATPEVAILSSATRIDANDLVIVTVDSFPGLDSINRDIDASIYLYDLTLRAHHDKRSYQIGYREERYQDDEFETLVGLPPFQMETETADDLRFQKLYGNLYASLTERLRYFFSADYSRWHENQFKESRPHYTAALSWRPRGELGITFARWTWTAEGTGFGGSLENTHAFDIPLWNNQQAFTQLISTSMTASWRRQNFYSTVWLKQEDQAFHVTHTMDEEPARYAREIRNRVAQGEAIYNPSDRTSLFMQLSARDAELVSTEDSRVTNLPESMLTAHAKLGVHHFISKLFTLVYELETVRQRRGYFDIYNTEEEIKESDSAVLANARLRLNLLPGTSFITLDFLNITDNRLSLYEGPIEGSSGPSLPTRAAIPPRRTIMLNMSHRF